MGRSKQRWHPLGKLEELSQLVFANKKAKELIELARKKSPAEAAREAVKIVAEEKVVQACRWLAILKRCHGPVKFEKAVAKLSKKAQIINII